MPSNHGFWGEKDLVEDGMNLPIPSKKDHGPYLFSRDRSVPRDKARFTPMVVSKEATHCPPISPIKVPKSTIRAWWSCWRESIITMSYKIMVRVTNRKENEVFVSRMIIGEA